MASGRGSDVTATSADWSRLPGPAMYPVSAASLLPRAATAATQEMAILKYELWRTKRSSEAWMMAGRTTVLAIEDGFTASPHFLPSRTSETPDICSASNLCLSFQVIFIYLFGSSFYLLLSRLSRRPGQRISCWSSCSAVFVLNTVKAP